MIQVMCNGGKVHLDLDSFDYLSVQPCSGAGVSSPARNLLPRKLIRFL